MARIRTVKPSFFSSLSNSELPKTTRLTFIGLWTYVDDKGRGVDDARLIKAAVWPLDDDYTTKKVEADMVRLAEANKIGRYEVGGRRFFAVRKWDHQRIDKPQKSILPAAPWQEDSGNVLGMGQEDSRSAPGEVPPKDGGEVEGKGIGREGNGGGEEWKGTGRESSSSVPESPEGDAGRSEEEELDVKVSKAARLVAGRRLERRSAEDQINNPESWLTKTAVGVMPDVRALALSHPEATAEELAQLVNGSGKPKPKRAPEAPEQRPPYHRPYVSADS